MTYEYSDAQGQPRNPTYREYHDGPRSAFPPLGMVLQQPPFYPFDKNSYETGCRPYEPQAEVAALKHRMAVLEKRVDALVALLTNPKDPEAGPSGFPAPIALTGFQPNDRPYLPPMQEQTQDIDLDTLILAQRQHHQQSPWARRYDVV